MKTNVGNNEGQRNAINKVSVVVDLAEQTVSFGGYVTHIENVDTAIVFFGAGEDHAIGEIDRASGVMSATAIKGNLATSYELFCRSVTPSASRKTKREMRIAVNIAKLPETSPADPFLPFIGFDAYHQSRQGL